MAAPYSEGKVGSLSTGLDQDVSVNGSFLHKDSIEKERRKVRLDPQIDFSVLKIHFC